MASTVYDFSCATPGGNKKSLADYRGKVLLVVNVASKCGLTPQYEALEQIYRNYKDQGFEVLGSPPTTSSGRSPAPTTRSPSSATSTTR